MSNALIKVFISHSSRQKSSYAEPIAKIVGLDQCIIDAYDFEPAYRTMDEIIKGIDRSSIFVFLASKESLNSAWCKCEIVKAKQKFESRQIHQFLVYIIDPDVTIADLPDWISKDECFNLKYFRSPVLIARDINQKIRKLQWSINPKLKTEYNVFVGRNKEIEEFQYKKAIKPQAKALIISGRPGSGREHFAKRCMQECKVPDYAIPEKICLERDDSIENIIVQLNANTFLLSDELLADVLLSDEDTKLKFAVEQLNEICQYGFIIIYESRSIARDRGTLADWFVKLINHPDLCAKLRTCVVASQRVRAHQETSELICIEFDELTDRDRRIILSKYIEEYGAAPLSTDNVRYFSDRLLHSPSQLKTIAEIIANRGIQEAKRCIGNEEEKGRSMIGKLINNYAANEDALEFLLLMAQLETVSYTDLEEIYQKRFAIIEHIIPQLIDSSFISEFGPSDSFLKIDTAIGDYLQRSKKTISKQLRRQLKSYLTKIAENPPASITEDLTTYMLTLREAIKDGRMKVESLLLPSTALKAIISLYQEDKTDSYQRVKLLCTELLTKGHIINLNTSFKDDVTYWLCLSLAHLGNEKEFFHYVQSFKGEKADFLKGFWFRQQKNFQKAKDYYQKVLNARFGASKKKAQTEMVIVLMQLKEYDSAYTLARELYDLDKDNPYYISVLFSTSVRIKNEPNVCQLQHELINRMSQMIIKDQEQYTAAMKLYLTVKNLKTDRETKYREINSLRDMYRDNIITYLNDAITYSIDYLK